MKNEIKIGVIGLGYVGLPLAIEFGKKYYTIGFDTAVNTSLEAIDKIISYFQEAKQSLLFFKARRQSKDVL
jgi:UDP-N-acetyl-D-mannosaminuronate dehydrogenase